MRITQLEYTAPSQSHPIGSLVLGVEIPVLFKEGVKEVDDKDDADVSLSVKTVELLEQVKESIINDISK